MKNPNVLTSTFSLFIFLGSLISQAFASEILWSQYCQHLGKMKLLVHLDTDPTAAEEKDSLTVKLWLRENAGDQWKLAQSEPVNRLTATALFTIEAWPRHTRRLFRVTRGDSDSIN